MRRTVYLTSLAEYLSRMSGKALDASWTSFRYSDTRQHSIMRIMLWEISNRLLSTLGLAYFCSITLRRMKMALCTSASSCPSPAISSKNLKC